MCLLRIGSKFVGERVIEIDAKPSDYIIYFSSANDPLTWHSKTISYEFNLNIAFLGLKFVGIVLCVIALIVVACYVRKLWTAGSNARFLIQTHP